MIGSSQVTPIIKESELMYRASQRHADLEALEEMHLWWIMFGNILQNTETANTEREQQDVLKNVKGVALGEP